MKENPYAPVAKMGENLLVWSRGAWQARVITYIEPLPASSPLVLDFGSVAASSTITSAIATSIRQDDGYLVELWMRPLDDIEIVLWLLQGQQKFRIKEVAARVSLLTGITDPYWHTSRFAVLDRDNDPYIEIRNPTAYALGSTLVAFWGNKYLVNEVSSDKARQMLSGQIPATRVVAQARVS
jgi:hypothetical protein